MAESKIQSVLIAALGGEGGGVLADWLVQCARQAGLPVQATSVPGVAQRTGATSYYVEWCRTPLRAGEAAPVFALSPMPARVDVVIASEALEAARMMERGFVTPERSCLITSTSRVYTTLEKMHMADGRFDLARIETLAKTLAQRAILFDMEAVTLAHKTVVSAVMFGALSGAGVLPWSAEVCEAVITASGKGVQASLAGFRAAHAIAAQGQAAPAQPAALQPELQEILRLGMARCEDFQDRAYAEDYREQVEAIGPGLPHDAALHAAWSEAARHLALWMCYEDVVRVADLKTRPERFARIRAEAQAGEHELVQVTEHFKPGIDEIASILPAPLGRALLAWAERHGQTHWHKGLHIRSTRLGGYLMLRALARLRPWRRRSLRFAQEAQAREAWWAAMRALAPRSTALAAALAGLPQLLKGYGDTQRRGRESYERLWQAHVQPVLDGRQDADTAAPALREAIARALADPEGRLNATPREQPIQWFKKIPT